MDVDRASSIRRRALIAMLAGLGMWLASFLMPLLFGEGRGWSDEDAAAYVRAGARLHDLIEAAHDHEHERPPFANEAAEQAYREAVKSRGHQHGKVDPEELKAARVEFARQKARLDAVRGGNARQIAVLFWGGVALGGLGAAAFFAAGRCDLD